MRAGVGFDAHRLVPGRALVLGGVEIPFGRGLEGHSDGDVLCHAIADAVLGATGAGDIGAHFPSFDSKWSGASSLGFLEQVAALVAETGGRIENVDATIVLEEPRVADAIERMRKAVAGALGLEVERVSIKATTTDGLGFAGRGEGAAAFAVAVVEVS